MFRHGGKLPIPQIYQVGNMRIERKPLNIQTMCRIFKLFQPKTYHFIEQL